MTFTFDASIISDLHKDATGFRPRADFWQVWEESNCVQKQKIWDELVAELDEAVAREKQEQAEAIQKFEEMIQTNISLGANSRQAAIRWIIQSLGENVGNDAGYACYILGIPYEMETEIRQVL